jgi:beta-galactosidase/beta-glucuronidase
LDQGWQNQPEVFDQTITVPFPPESRASGIGDAGFHPVVWYRRIFVVSDSDRDKRLILHFGAVDYRARVWVNGQLVAEHEGGMSPFSADITTALVSGDAEQVIVVRAEDLPGDLSQPRGKQDWLAEPHGIFYHRTTGIWQPVWLEAVSPVHIVDVRWTPDVANLQLGVQVRLNQEPDRPLALRIHLSVNGSSLADDRYAVHGDAVARVLDLKTSDASTPRDDLIWSPSQPTLIDATIELLDGEAPIDTVVSYAGLRTVGVADGRFLLNGRPTFLRLALEQGYWPESHLAAPSVEAMRQEVELTKALGFNGIRIHQKVEDPRFLYWCDRLGLLVWGEMANAYVFSREAMERFTREWLDVIRRDYNHPSIITWVPFNESWGVPNAGQDPAQQNAIRALYYLTKSLDPTRPVIGNDGWELAASDIWGIHDYAFDAEVLTERYGTPEAVEHTLRNVQPASRRILLSETPRGDAPVMITEFGGISLAPKSGERWHGYGTVESDTDYLARYKALLDALIDAPSIAGFCYTQLTDTEQETNGLLTEDRQPKLDLDALHAITSRPSASVPSERTAALRKQAKGVAEE